MLVRLKSTDAPARKEKVDRNKSEKSSERHGELLIRRSWTSDENSACAFWAVRSKSAAQKPTIVSHPLRRNSWGEVVLRLALKSLAAAFCLATPTTCILLKQTTPKKIQTQDLCLLCVCVTRVEREKEREIQRHRRCWFSAPRMWALESRYRVCALSPPSRAPTSTGEAKKAGMVSNLTVFTSSSCLRANTLLWRVLGLLIQCFWKLLEIFTCKKKKKKITDPL